MSGSAKPMPSILLWGGRSQARLVAAMLEESKLGRPSVIFDDTLDEPEFASNARFVNRPEALKELLAGLDNCVVCIGGEHGFARVMTAEVLEGLGLPALTIVHRTSFVEPSAAIGRGCQLMPSALIHKFSQVSSQCIVNTGARVDHECRIGRGVHIMGSAAVAGRVMIGDFATIGTNASILPDVTIGEGAFVGAGAVVTRDVGPYDVVAGVPARKLRSRSQKFDDGALRRLL